MKYITTLFLFMSVFSYSQKVVRSKVTANNGIEYKRGQEITFSDFSYKIKKIYNDKKTGELFFEIIGDQKITINVNQEIKNCNIKPCEIVKTIDYDNCRYKRDEFDRFTKKSVKQTRGKLIYSDFSRSVSVHGFKVDGSKYLEVLFTDNQLFSFNEGGSFMLMLKDEEVVTLNFEKSIVADYARAGNFDIWKIRTLLPLNQALFNKLVDSNVFEFRYYTVDRYVEKKIGEKSRNNIASVLKCIE
ncbi:hypothetical protein [Aquimarina macrocephali]|uniref:hypothetical protein n=1 Tax=Aquimarina macrocephali TaxID=666563 RepID=UPI003F674382